MEIIWLRWRGGDRLVEPTRGSRAARFVEGRFEEQCVETVGVALDAPDESLAFEGRECGLDAFCRQVEFAGGTFVTGVARTRYRACRAAAPQVAKYAFLAPFQAFCSVDRFEKFIPNAIA
jgi:hypothetical protein